MIQNHTMMKKLWIILILTLLGTAAASAQTVYAVNYKSDAQVKVYVAKYKSDADLVIFFTDYKSDAGWRRRDKQHLMY